MKLLKLSVIAVIIILSTLSGCTFIGNTFIYKAETKEFIQDLLQADYNKCTTLFDMSANNPDTIKKQLPVFREGIIKAFDENLDYTFVSAEKTVTNYVFSPGKNSETTEVFMQISNDKIFGLIKVVYNDQTHKIIDIRVSDKTLRVPDMWPFWLFGIIALCVPAFNIYMIIKVRRSNIKTKWPKYMAIIFLNIPSFGFNLLSGFFFKLFGLQLLFGISLSMMGYSSSSWEIGIPIGSLIVLYRLQKGLFKTKDSKDLTGDEYIEPEVAE